MTRKAKELTDSDRLQVIQLREATKTEAEAQAAAKLAKQAPPWFYARIGEQRQRCFIKEEVKSRASLPPSQKIK